MAVKVNMKPTSTIKANLGLTPNGAVQTYFTKTCADYMDKYVPYREGGLAYDTRRIEGNLIIYDAPYAHYMYEGKVMGPNIPIYEDGVLVGYWSKAPKYYTGEDINYHPSAGHEYAGPHWDERMKTAEMGDLVKDVQNYINRGGK